MKLATIPGVEIFAAGTFHKGTPEEVTFTEADLDAIVANFSRLSGGERPTYEPFVKLGKVDPHKGEPVVFEEGNPAAAVVRNLRRDGKRLIADFADVQADPAKWIELKVYRKVSAEIDKPPDGEDHPEFGCKGPVLKAVALLGANPPAVKGLKDIPTPKFASTRTKITHFCFAEVSMDRQAMLDYLASMGVDVALIGDAIPDELLAAIVTAWKASVPADQQQMAEEEEPVLAGATGATGTHVAAPPARPPQLLPKSLTAKFVEIGRLTAKVATLEATAKATASIIGQTHDAAKRTFVHTFCEQMVKENRLTPADVECNDKGEPLPHSELALLLDLDHTKKHVFAEGGKQVQKTKLEIQMERIKARKPHTFSEKVAAGGKPDLYAKIRADVAAERAAKAAQTSGKTLHEKLHLIPSGGMR